MDSISCLKAENPPTSSQRSVPSRDVHIKGDSVNYCSFCGEFPEVKGQSQKLQRIGGTAGRRRGRLGMEGGRSM